MKYLFLFTVFLHLFSNAQEQPTVPSQQHLNKLEYEELLDVFNTHEFDSIAAEKIARTYLDRARKDGDTIKMARGYDRLARIFHPKKNIQFTDSIIMLTEKMDHITYPGLGYIIKALEYNKLADIEEEYKNFTLAYEHSSNTDNLLNQVFIIDRLIHMRVLWGDRAKALEFQRNRHSIVMSDSYLFEIKKATRKTNQNDLSNQLVREKIISNRAFVYCYLLMENYKLARIHLETLKEQLDLYDGYDKQDHNIWFLNMGMELAYFENNFSETIQYANVLKKMNMVDGNLRLKNVFLYKGLSSLELGNQTEGLNLLKKADSIYKTHPNYLDIINDQLLYKTLYDQSSSKFNAKKIEYLNRLLAIDSLFIKNYRFFEPNHMKEFETPLLLREKEMLIDQLKHKNDKSKRIVYWIGLTCALFLVGLMYSFYIQLLYKKRFQKLMDDIDVKKIDVVVRGRRETDLSIEVVDSIMNHLKKFEDNRGYTSTKITLQYLATKFETNSNYLSRVINMKKEVNFSQYLHDLRISYAISDILSQSTFQKYTISAIAQECGYSNGESFSKAFKKKTGIYPSYYIKQLENLNKSSLN